MVDRCGHELRPLLAEPGTRLPVERRSVRDHVDRGKAPVAVVDQSFASSRCAERRLAEPIPAPRQDAEYAQPVLLSDWFCRGGVPSTKSIKARFLLPPVWRYAGIVARGELRREQRLGVLGRNGRIVDETVVNALPRLEPNTIRRVVDLLAKVTSGDDQRSVAEVANALAIGRRRRHMVLDPREFDVHAIDQAALCPGRNSACREGEGSPRSAPR